MNRIRVNPVWGDVQPTSVIGYKIVVVPKTYAETCWDFLILIPSGDEEQEDIVLVSQMCEAALKVGDTFHMYRLSHGEEEEYQNMPVLLFSEVDDQPYWLVPPNHLMH